jgi:hypothetical protein
MLNQLKNYNAQGRLDLDDLVAIASFGRALCTEYAEQKLEVPEWVSSQLRAVRHDIRAKVSDRIEARKKEIKLTLQRLATPAERRAALEEEYTALNTPVT